VAGDLISTIAQRAARLRSTIVHVNKAVVLLTTLR
jgi:hypothetical protein